MNIKAIISDFDGTLVDLNGNYAPQIPAILEEIKENKIHFSLATGRSFFGPVAKVVSELKLDALHITNGGSLIINPLSGEMPWHKPISQASTEKVVSYFDGQDLIFSLETKDKAYMSKNVESRAYINTPVEQLDRREIPQEVLKILLHAASNKTNEQQVKKITEELQNICHDIELTKFAYKDCFGMDITSLNSTKHTAVLEYLKLLNLKPEEVVAIGDGYNDYPLFTACGYKIAIGNAPKELTDIANLVVDKIEDGGMIQALNHVLFLKHQG